jgi:hypothetical protein
MYTYLAYPNTIISHVESTMSTPTRGGGRHVVANDGSSATYEDSLVTVMRRKAAPNLDSTGTAKSIKSFLPFTTIVNSTKLGFILAS